MLPLGYADHFFYEYLIELRRHKRNPESSDKLRRTDSESRVSNSCLIHITLTLVCLMTLCNWKQFYSSPLISCALQPLASCLEENRYLVLNIAKLLLTPSRRFQFLLEYLWLYRQIDVVNCTIFNCSITLALFLLQSRSGSHVGHSPVKRKASYKGMVRRSRSISVYYDSTGGTSRMYFLYLTYCHGI